MDDNLNLPPWVTQSAYFTTPHHRLWLRRRLKGTGPPVSFLLHNPSTASHDRDDPTLRRGITIANTLNASSLIFVNMFTAVATDANDLVDVDDPVGTLADYAIDVAWRMSGVMIVAPGVPKGRVGTRRLGATRYRTIIENLSAEAMTVYAMRITKSGYPEHLLYLPGTLTPFPINSDPSSST